MSAATPQDTFRSQWRRLLLSPNGPPPTRRFLLLTLSHYADTLGGSCFPSQQRLAHETGLSLRAVVSHLAAAERDGWILRHTRTDDVHRASGGRGWRRTSYTLVVPDVVQAVHHANDGAAGGERPGVVHSTHNPSDAVQTVHDAEAQRGANDGTDVVHGLHTSSQDKEQKAASEEMCRVRACEGAGARAHEGTGAASTADCDPDMAAAILDMCRGIGIYVHAVGDKLDVRGGEGYEGIVEGLRSHESDVLKLLHAAGGFAPCPGAGCGNYRDAILPGGFCRECTDRWRRMQGAA